MIIVSGTVEIASADAVERLRPAMMVQLESSRAEDGCLSYNYGVDVLNPKIIHVIEQWQDWDALEAHFAQPHMVPWRDALAAVGIVSRSLTAAEVNFVKDV